MDNTNNFSATSTDSSNNDQSLDSSSPSTMPDNSSPSSSDYSMTSPSSNTFDSSSPSSSYSMTNPSSNASDGSSPSSSDYSITSPSSNTSDVSSSSPSSYAKTSPSTSNTSSSNHSQTHSSPSISPSTPREKSTSVSPSTLPSQTLSSSIEQENKPAFKDKLLDATPLVLTFLCLGFLVLIQNLAQTCKRFCQTDSCLSNSIMSGTSLGFIFSKTLPFLITFIQESHQIENIYLKKTNHLLLATFFVLGSGLLFNYFFEKKTARNTVEEVAHTDALYSFNMIILGFVSFFVGFHITTFLNYGIFEMLEYTFFAGLLLYSENSTLCNIFQSRSSFFRRIALSIALFVGFFASKLSLLTFTPLIGILSISFVIGFFMFTTLRVEMALVKRNSNYTAFMISFIGLCALTIIQSLYESVRC